MDTYIDQFSRQLSQGDAIFFACFLLPVLIGTLYAFHRITKFEIGPKLAAEQSQKLWLIVPVVLLIFLLAPFIPRQWLSGSFLAVFFFAMAALFFGLTSWRLYLRATIKADEILLNLGRVETKTLALFGIVFIISAISMAFNLRPSSQLYWTYVSQIAAFFMMGCFWLAHSLVSVYITTNGISRFGGQINWTDLTAFQWAGEHIPIVTIVIKGKEKVSWYIPTHHREELDELLRLNTSQTANDGHNPLSSSL